MRACGRGRALAFIFVQREGTHSFVFVERALWLFQEDRPPRVWTLLRLGFILCTIDLWRSKSMI